MFPRNGFGTAKVDGKPENSKNAIFQKTKL